MSEWFAVVDYLTCFFICTIRASACMTCTHMCADMGMHHLPVFAHRCMEESVEHPVRSHQIDNLQSEYASFFPLA